MNYIKTNTEKNIIFILFFFIVLFHLTCIKFYPVNDEFVFPIGAILIEKFNIKDLDVFFNYNANTLGFSFLIYFLSNLTNIDYFLIAKLISLSGLLFLIVGFFNFLNVIKFKGINIYLFLILFLNPLIFNFSLRGTPDFFGSAISFFAISIFINHNKIFIKYISIILFGIGVIIKPTNAILLILNFLNTEKFFLKNSIQIDIIKNFILLLFIPIIYFLLNYYFFGFFVVPNNFSYLGDFKTKKYVINFITYIGFLGLMTSPLYLKYHEDLYTKKIFKILIYIFISILFSLFFMERSGELNFGFLTKILGEKIYFFIISFSFILLFDLIFFHKKKFDNNEKIIFVLLLLYIIILSKFHSSQRYLLTILPIYLFIIYKNYFNKILAILTIVLYSFLNLILFLNYYKTQNHVKNLVNFLMENKIIYKTHPGYLGQHALNFFFQFEEESENFIGNKNIFDKEKKFYVSKKKPEINEKIIFVSKSKNIFLEVEKIYIIEKQK